ncbi:uncharacterized protein LY79DRAFT_330235 [Colletotrichum navitas]|uniref:Transmembrane protein n=1 Tax=Colletotrichum navitas TaxID=681940 RepID=A0AAD8PSW1_9PEZI|nr:uncharacterized protein LY79DRAFT_330235 [Colletotrichum navitas]KAK1579971.1 hypothetical protein LY79DRAFT_330235 [Colletotrichum navitas]
MVVSYYRMDDKGPDSNGRERERDKEWREGRGIQGSTALGRGPGPNQKGRRFKKMKGRKKKKGISFFLLQNEDTRTCQYRSIMPCSFLGLSKSHIVYPYIRLTSPALPPSPFPLKRCPFREPRYASSFISLGFSLTITFILLLCVSRRRLLS